MTLPVTSLKKFAVACILCIAAVNSWASMLSFSPTNSWGQPDTNIVSIIRCNTNAVPVDSFGNPITRGVPMRISPTNGVVSFYALTGNYLVTSPTLSPGIVYRFPDNSTLPTAYAISGYNTFVTPAANTIIVTNTIVTGQFGGVQYDEPGATNTGFIQFDP